MCKLLSSPVLDNTKQIDLTLLETHQKVITGLKKYLDQNPDDPNLTDLKKSSQVLTKLFLGKCMALLNDPSTKSRYRHHVRCWKNATHKEWVNLKKYVDSPSQVKPKEPKDKTSKKVYHLVRTTLESKPSLEVPKTQRPPRPS